MAEKFWIIWNPQSDRPPQVRYSSEKEAEEVAKKMVKEHHQSFIVMESRHGYEPGVPRRVGYTAKPKVGKRGYPIYKTYNEWRKEGRQVIRGQKSHKRNENGEAVFAYTQTEPHIRRDYDYDDPITYLDLHDLD